MEQKVEGRGQGCPVPREVKYHLPAQHQQQFDIVDKYSGVCVSGDRKIPVSEAVSNVYRVPEEVRILGHAVITLYVDERIKKIEAHNLEIKERVREETLTLREATRGHGVVRCPDCDEDVPWGNLMNHRMRTCANIRV